MMMMINFEVEVVSNSPSPPKKHIEQASPHTRHHRTPVRAVLLPFFQV